MSDTDLHAALWNAINEYTAACGGNTSNASISDSRMDAVVAVERALTLFWALNCVRRLVECEKQRQT